MASSSLFGAQITSGTVGSSLAGRFTAAGTAIGVNPDLVGAVTFQPGVISPGLITPGFIDPGIVFPTPFPFPQPTPQPPASPTASASDLQVMINAIPVAQEGHVITSEYHNALRLALIAIANRLGLGTVAEEITVTAAPDFRDHGAVRGWEQDYGLARKPGDLTSGNVHGWMELELPDGARIKRMVVYGRSASTTAGTATTATLRVQLRRQQITNPTISALLIEVTVGDVDAARGVEGTVTMPGSGAGAAAIEEFRIVNNREHKYLLIAELDNLDQNTTAQINAVQVVCGR